MLTKREQRDAYVRYGGDVSKLHPSMLNDDPPIPPGPQLRKNISAFLGWVVIVVLGIVGLAIVIAAVILVGTALGAVPPMTIVILLLYIIAFRGKE